MVLAWLLLAIALLCVELAAVSLISIFGALAALVAAALAYLRTPTPLQILAFAIAALLLPVLLRRRLLERVAGRGLPSRTDALAGALGEVTEAVDPIRGKGRVNVNGQDWAIRSDAPISLGTIVRVDSADGIVLHVSVVALPAANDPIP
jgi:membrane protein implicated in regulation of membrane protease activity